MAIVDSFSVGFARDPPNPMPKRAGSDKFRLRSTAETAAQAG
jgi:hypothetical protein